MDMVEKYTSYKASLVDENPDFEPETLLILIISVETNILVTLSDQLFIYNCYQVWGQHACLPFPAWQQGKDMTSIWDVISKQGLYLHEISETLKDKNKKEYTELENLLLFYI